MALQPLKDRRILVVEDDPIIAIDLQQTLESAGAVVIGPASNLDAALRFLENSVFDAAVLDVRLEQGDTLPLATLLMRRRALFLFQTSDAGLVSGLYPGVPILRKPFRPEHLVASLEVLLAASSSP